MALALLAAACGSNPNPNDPTSPDQIVGNNVPPTTVATVTMTFCRTTDPLGGACVADVAASADGSYSLPKGTGFLLRFQVTNPQAAGRSIEHSLRCVSFIPVGFPPETCNSFPPIVQQEPQVGPNDMSDETQGPVSIAADVAYNFTSTESGGNLPQANVISRDVLLHVR